MRTHRAAVCLSREPQAEVEAAPGRATQSSPREHRADEHTTQHSAEQKAEEHTTEHRADKCKQLLPAKVCSAPVTARVTPSIPIMIIPMILCSSSWLITHFWNINVYRHDNDLYHNDQTPFIQIMGIQHYLKTSIVVVIAKRMRGLVLVVFKHKTGWRKIWGAHRPFAKHRKCTKLGDAVQNTQSPPPSFGALVCWEATTAFWPSRVHLFVVLATRNHQLLYVFDMRYVHISAL